MQTQKLFTHRRPFPRFIVATVLVMTAASSYAASVQFQTFLGNFEVDLFDQHTPLASAEFLSLVSEGAYRNSIVHRVENNTILQGGGFALEGDSLQIIAHDDVLRSEVLFSNVRGTLAFADSAETDTNARSVQWFINLADNSKLLDNQNGGYTVFGQVRETGMTVVDAIASLQKLNFDAFPGLPLLNYSAQDAEAGVPIKSENYAVIYDIVSLSEGPNQNFSLPPIISERAPSQTAPPNTDNDDAIKGIGALGWVSLAGLLALALVRKKFPSSGK